jgi:hypothetical protein
MPRRQRVLVSVTVVQDRAGCCGEESPRAAGRSNRGYWRAPCNGGQEIEHGLGTSHVGTTQRGSDAALARSRCARRSAATGNCTGRGVPACAASTIGSDDAQHAAGVEDRIQLYSSFKGPLATAARRRGAALRRRGRGRRRAVTWCARGRRRQQPLLRILKLVLTLANGVARRSSFPRRGLRLRRPAIFARLRANVEGPAALVTGVVHSVASVPPGYVNFLHVLLVGYHPLANHRRFTIPSHGRPSRHGGASATAGQSTYQPSDASEHKRRKEEDDVDWR